MLTAGLLLTATGGALYARMPAGGHYFWDVFPGLLVSAIGLAAVATIASTATSHYADSHAVLASDGPALTHGFQAAFYALIGVALVGAAIAAVFVEPKPALRAANVEVALEHAA